MAAIGALAQALDSACRGVDMVPCEIRRKRQLTNAGHVPVHTQAAPAPCLAPMKSGWQALKRRLWQFVAPRPSDVAEQPAILSCSTTTCDSVPLQVDEQGSSSSTDLYVTAAHAGGASGKGVAAAPAVLSSA